MEVPGKRTDIDDEEENIDKIEKLCEPCEGDKVNTPASGFCNECEEFMCNSCFRQHLRGKLCRHHTCSETCLRRNARYMVCKQHEEKTIKFFCRIHEAVGCEVCMEIGHKACNSEYIKDLSDNFQQNEGYKTFMRRIDQLISDRKEFEKEILENEDDNKSMLGKALWDIKQFRLDINEYLDKVETDIISEAKNVMGENETLLIKLKNDCTVISTKLEEITNKLNSELYKENACFIHTVECKPKVSECELAIADMKLKPIKKFEFVCDQQLRSIITSEQKLGTMTISTSVVSNQSTKGASDKTKSQRNANENVECIYKREDKAKENVDGRYKSDKSVRMTDQATSKTKSGKTALYF